MRYRDRPCPVRPENSGACYAEIDCALVCVVVGLPFLPQFGGKIEKWRRVLATAGALFFFAEHVASSLCLSPQWLQMGRRVHEPTLLETSDTLYSEFGAPPAGTPGGGHVEHK